MYCRGALQAKGKAALTEGAANFPSWAAPGEPIAGVVPPQYDEQGGTAIVRMKIVCMQVVL